tara:strand:+ start:255 stop:665 length:411 start_codon:yes stop_codon:yes gene_type:complete
MILKMHETIKAALYSQTDSGEFTTLVGSKIYDTIGPPDTQGPFAIWNMEAVTITDHTDGKERVEANISVLVVTDLRKGVSDHLTILDALAALRNYSATINSTTDRLTFRMISTGEVQAEDKHIVSRTVFLATSGRI